MCGLFKKSTASILDEEHVENEDPTNLGLDEYGVMIRMEVKRI